MEVKLTKEEAPLLALGLVILIVATALAAVGGTVPALQEISLAYFVLLLAFVVMLISYLSRTRS